MRRSDLTEKILDIKRERGWTWKFIAAEIGGMSPILIVGALLGQMKLARSQAEKAAELFGLSEAEKPLLNEVPMRGTPMPPTDPLIYRFYELVMVNAPALKALIEEEFGDGIMSRSTSISLSKDRPTRAATGSSLRCRASSSPTNTTARPAMFQPMDIGRNNARGCDAQIP
jgi:cyanate lyase